MRKNTYWSDVRPSVRPSVPPPHPVQNEALGKLKALSDIVKSGSQKMSADDLKMCIRQDSYMEALSDLLSPLNPSIILSEIWWVQPFCCGESFSRFKGCLDNVWVLPPFRLIMIMSWDYELRIAQTHN